MQYNIICISYLKQHVQSKYTTQLQPTSMGPSSSRVSLTEGRNPARLIDQDPPLACVDMRDLDSVVARLPPGTRSTHKHTQAHTSTHTHTHTHTHTQHETFRNFRAHTTCNIGKQKKHRTWCACKHY